MTWHVIAYRSTELLFGTHTFTFSCFFDGFNCVFTQISCLSRLLAYLKNTFPIYLLCSRTIAQIPTFLSLKKFKKVHLSNHLKKTPFGSTSLRENGILKTDSKEKASICNTIIGNSNQPLHGKMTDRPSKGASPFSSMGDI